MTKWDEVQRIAKDFRELPEKAQEVWFQFCLGSMMQDKYENMGFLVENTFIHEIHKCCISPIEQIYYFTYTLMDYDVNEGKRPSMAILPQHKVEANGNIYYLDFYFDAKTCGYGVDYKLAIECDGHDFHEKSKKQVAHDNERALNLKMAGYDILRFSGSQIYKEPFKCVLQTMNYILSKVEHK